VLGGLGGPEVVDQLLAGDDLAVVHEQVHQQRPLLGAARLDGLAVPHHLQGAEHPELHERHLRARESRPEASRERA
jgi:hypothetical protein